MLDNEWFMFLYGADEGSRYFFELKKLLNTCLFPVTIKLSESI